MVWVTLHLLVDAEEVVLQVKVDRTAQHYEDGEFCFSLLSIPELNRFIIYTKPYCIFIVQLNSTVMH